MRRVLARPRISTPSDFHEKSCWKIRWPRSPAKKRALGRFPPNAAKKRSCDTLMSCASSTTAKSNGGLWLAASAVASAVNMAACVKMPRSLICLCNRSKMDHKIARCASGSRVLRPSRATSRYAAQLSNCHASTTCSHSVNRKCGLNLWALTASDAARRSSFTSSRLARFTGPHSALCRRSPTALIE
jgi:hypothetical protein